MTPDISVEALRKLGDGSTYQIITEAQKLKMNYPLKVGRPPMPKNPSSIELEKYLDELKEWEKQDELLEEKRQIVKGHNNLIEENLLTIIEQDANIEDVPIKYRGNVKSFAWNRSHAYGLYEYYNYLVSMVDIFQVD